MQLDLGTMKGARADEVAAERPTRIEAAAPGCTMKRPGRTDEAVRAAASLLIADRCREWDDQTSREDWAESLLKCASHWEDGYDLAKAMERYLVGPDAELVAILDDAPGIVSQVLDRAVRQWVTIVGFDPVHAVGDVVSCRMGTGAITAIRVETAEYVVDTKAQGRGGYLMAAEDVRPAAVAEGGA